MSQLSKYRVYYSGSGTSLSGYTYTPVNSLVYQDNRLDPVKRVRPKGVEILFNPTPVSSNKLRYSYGTDIKLSYSGSGSGTVIFMSQNVISGSVRPGKTAAWNPVTNSTVWSTELRNKIRNVNLNLAQAFAERKQTEGMFRDFVKRIVKASRAIRKGRPQDIYDALTGSKRKLPAKWKGGFSLEAQKRASENWLAFQYGVRPLISDLAGSVSEYFHARGSRPLIRHVTLRVKDIKEHGYIYNLRSPPEDSFADECNITMSRYIGCNCEFDDDAASFSSTASRLGLTNPALLVWELIPYSFVVDWFINVGDYLSASESIKGLRRVAITDTMRTTYISTRTMARGAQGYAKEVYVDRRVYTSLPLPALHFKRDPLSLSHTLSALALLVTGPLRNQYSKR